MVQETRAQTNGIAANIIYFFTKPNFVYWDSIHKVCSFLQNSSSKHLTTVSLRRYTGKKPYRILKAVH
jgi:hypothetical protein